MAGQRVAFDVGGTFTDVCIFDEDTQNIRVTKVPSTPHDPMESVIAGVERGEVDLSRVNLFSHGTTVATNALITRRFPAAAMVTTRGFRDVIEIHDRTKDDLWDAYDDVARPTSGVGTVSRSPSGSMPPVGSRNGPQSAGAAPGPACHDTGGEDPTNTDTNVVLGRLGTSLAGSAKELDARLATKTISEIAETLGLEMAEAAGAIVKVANANMADAVRLVSI